MAASPELKAEAMRLARDMVVDAIRAKRQKLCWFKSSEINKAARIVLKRKIVIWSWARSNIRRRRYGR